MKVDIRRSQASVWREDLPDLAMLLVDKALRLDPRLAEALSDARQAATVLAKESGRRISTPKTIQAASECLANGIQEMAVPVRTFSAWTPGLVGEVDNAVRLIVEFETQPM